MLDFQPEFPRIINQNSPAIQLRTGSMPNFISPILFCREGKYEQPFFLIGRRCQSKDNFLAPATCLIYVFLFFLVITGLRSFSRCFNALSLVQLHRLGGM